MDTASRLNTLATGVEASDSANERSRFFVAQELDRAAELLPERVLPAIRHLESAKLPKTGYSKMSLAPESSRPPRPSSRDSSAVNPASAGRPAPATDGSSADAIAGRPAPATDGSSADAIAGCTAPATAGWDLRSTAAGSEQTAGADTAETVRHGRSGSCVEPRR